MAEMGDLGKAAGRAFADSVDDEWRRKVSDKISAPCRVVNKGRIFIGDEELMLPILEGGIEVERRGRRNVLHLSILVGEVTMEGPGS